MVSDDIDREAQGLVDEIEEARNHAVAHLTHLRDNAIKVKKAIESTEAQIAAMDRRLEAMQIHRYARAAWLGEQSRKEPEDDGQETGAAPERGPGPGAAPEHVEAGHPESPGEDGTGHGDT